MPTPNELAVSVMARDAVAMRNAMVRRVIYAIADDEDPTDFVANTSGVVPLGLAFGGVVFWLAPDDTTSAHDGVSVIVTSDGYRYHISDFRMPWAVLATNQVEPPTSSAIGDAYLTNAAPTGDWAGHGEQIAVWTSRGWAFVEPQLGQLIYVADGSNRWVYLNEDGDIVERFGMQPGSIPDLALIGGQRRYIVESQTVNAPPVSPALGYYWIIGSAPTGVWAGGSGKIATSYDGGTTWTIIDPPDGVEAYDRALASNHIYRTGIGWISASGAWGRINRAYTAGTGSTTAPAGSSIYPGTGTPTTAHRRRIDNVTVNLQASRVGALIRVTYRFNSTFSLNNIGGSGSVNIASVALFRDAEANAIAVDNDLRVTEVDDIIRTATVLIEAEDTANHTYTIAIMSRRTGSSAIDVLPSLRHFVIEESF